MKKRKEENTQKKKEKKAVKKLIHHVDSLIYNSTVFKRSNKLMLFFVEEMKNFKNLLKKTFVLNEIEKITRLSVLDGFRGLLAISVVIQHTIGIFNMTGDYKWFNLLGTYVGVPSFFVLSSFLLTYKLFDQMNKSNGGYKDLLLIVIKYLIRRFFRIYVPYIIFCIHAKYFSITTKVGLWYESWFNLITLKSVGWNPLWTIPPEIRYYFFIPLLAFLTHKLQRFFAIWISVIIICMACTQWFDIYGQKCVYIEFNRERLSLSFQIFLIGSLIGLIYCKIQQINYEFRYLQRFRVCITYACIIMLLNGVRQSTYYYEKYKYSCQFTYGFYWSIFIFLMLFAEKSNFTEFINYRVFKSYGKYSFGIYLLHHDAFMIARLLYKDMSGLEFIFLTLCFSYLIGMLFFHIVEVPSMNLGNHLIRKLTEIEYFKRDKTGTRDASRGGPLS